MSSVNVVQPAEPRLQASPAPQSRGGEPFSDLLDSAANASREQDEAPPKPTSRSEPSAPRSRSQERPQSLARGEAPEQASANESRCESADRSAASGSAHSASEKDKASGSDGTEETESQSAPAGETATDGTALADADAEPPPMLATGAGLAAAIDDVAETETPDETQSADDASAVFAADAAIVPAAVPGAITEIVAAAAAPKGEPTGPLQSALSGAVAAAIADDTPPSGPAPAPQSASKNTSPAAVQPAETEPLNAVPVPPGHARAAMPNLDQAQAPQPAPANPTAPAAGENPFVSPDDADLPLQQPQNGSQAVQAKPQETGTPRSAEVVNLPTSSAEASAPRVQANPAMPVVTMPEPVRALAASLNPASLHAANVSDPNPVPLTGTALAVEIISRMREGTRRFDIRLDPPELGRVDVRLDVDRNGHATTKLTVDRPETLELLQREARGLERALQQAGLKTDEGGLEFSLRYQAHDGSAEDRTAATEPRPDLLAAADEERAEVVIESYRAAAHARGGVDIRI